MIKTEVDTVVFSAMIKLGLVYRDVTLAFYH